MLSNKAVLISNVSATVMKSPILSQLYGTLIVDTHLNQVQRLIFLSRVSLEKPQEVQYTRLR